MQAGAHYPNLTVLTGVFPRQVRGLLTIIRDRTTDRNRFVFYSDRLIRLLVEQALEFLPVSPHDVETPMGVSYSGVGFDGKICAVPILRAGLSMERAVRQICSKIRLGHVLIQRDEETALPIFTYKKLPTDIAQRYVLILDPMLATGGSVLSTIKVLLAAGVPEEHIIFVNLISCWQGIDRVFAAHPKMRIVTAEVDPELKERFYIVPGLGDFGDRYMGTE